MILWGLALFRGANCESQARPFGADLPADANGVDVPGVQIPQALRTDEGFHVIHQVVLLGRFRGSFSFCHGSPCFRVCSRPRSARRYIAKRNPQEKRDGVQRLVNPVTHY